MAFFQKVEENGTAGVLLALCIIMIAGFLFTRVTNLFRLPKVTGYIPEGFVHSAHVAKKETRAISGFL